jgi:nitrite reductase (NO-forming)/hydroxylamine reductase
LIPLINQEHASMSITQKTRRGLILLAASIGFATLSGTALAAKKFTPLNEAEFDKAKAMYFQRCAGCHGVLRKGATGKSLLPEPNKAKKSKGTLKLGTKRLAKIIKLGTEGGMNNFDDIFSDEEIDLLARYIQMEPPVPPEMSLALMKERHKVYIEPKDYPTKPLHGRNWENFFVVIERDTRYMSSRQPSITISRNRLVEYLDASGTPRAATAK